MLIPHAHTGGCGTLDFCKADFVDDCFDSGIGGCTDTLNAFLTGVGYKGPTSGGSGTIFTYGQKCTSLGCDDKMAWIVASSTVFFALFGALAILCGIGWFIAEKDTIYKHRFMSSAAASVVSFLAVVPAFGGGWNYVNAKSTYDIGPRDDIGYGILLIGAMLCFAAPMWIWVCCTCNKQMPSDCQQGNVVVTGPNVAVITTVTDTTYVTTQPPVASMGQVPPPPPAMKAPEAVAQA